MDPAIEATGLTKAYGAVRVLDGVDIAAPRGSVFCLLGPNGAGKTTTVRVLSTLTPPDGGTARVAGFDVVRERSRVRRRISLTGQSAAIDALQTGEENLRMMGVLTGLSRPDARKRARHLLEEFDLVDAAGRRVGTYSGGMRRRLDLAAGLVGRPEVIFLDEPTTGLDPRSRQAAWRIIAGLVADGVSVLLTTQYLEEADHLAHAIAVIDGGHVVAHGTPAQLKTRVAEQRLDLTLVDAQAYDEVVRTLDGHALRTDPAGRTVQVPTDGSAAAVRALLDDVDPHRVRIGAFAVRTATLDDVFMTLTGRGAATDKETANV